MKRVLTCVLSIMMVIVLSSCTQPAATESDTAGQTSAGSVSSEQTTAGTDSAEQSDTSPDTEKKPVKVGFANLHERNDFAKQVRNSMVKEAEARDWEIICVDNNADGATAIKNADDLITMGINYMIEFNIDSAVAPAVMEKFNAADIPVIAVDVEHPGAVYFGADNARAGQLAGEAAADYINEKWSGEYDYLVLIIQPASGETTATRINNVPEGMKNKGIEVPDEKVIEIDGQNDAQVAQARVADFLMAHPDAHKIIIGTVNDVTASGASAAAETAGRKYDVAIFSQNCTAVFVEPMYAANGDSNFIGSVGYFPDRYGEWVFPIIDKMVAGEKVEDKYYIDHVLIDWSNISEYYPIDNLPWKNLK